MGENTRREVCSESWSLRIENFEHVSKMFHEDIETEDRSKEKGQSVSVRFVDGTRERGSR